MKFPIRDFFSKCDQIYIKLRILSHLLKKSFTENFLFCAVYHCITRLSGATLVKTLKPGM